jgi:hypothetical protein
MRWTVVVPGALLPSPIAADVVSAATMPWLGAALARAQVDDDRPAVDDTLAPHLHWLWRQFGGTGEPVTAPYALRALDPEAEPGAQCWHVDPVHFSFARDRMLVAELDDPPSGAEADLLAGHLRSALDEFGASAGPKLHVRGSRWLLSLERGWSLRTTPLDGALGQSALDHWPVGADAAVWRRLLTDLQMRWHSEPLNEAREARGAAAVNAVWLHGGGAWSPLPARPFGAVASSDPVLRGWVLASGVPAHALHDEGELPAVRADVVSIRGELLAPAQFEAWGQWIERLAQLDQRLRDLQQGCFAAGGDELRLVLAGRRRARIARLRRRDAWRLWRKAPLAPLLAEAE